MKIPLTLNDIEHDLDVIMRIRGVSRNKAKSELRERLHHFSNMFEFEDEDLVYDYLDNNRVLH